MSENATKHSAPSINVDCNTKFILITNSNTREVVWCQSHSNIVYHMTLPEYNNLTIQVARCL